MSDASSDFEDDAPDAFCEECDRTFAHHHEAWTNFYGDPVQVVVSHSDRDQRQVLRDSETGEIIFEASKDRMRVVK